MGCNMKKYIKYLLCLYLIIMGIVIFTSKDLRMVTTDLSYVKCGSATGIPKPLPQLTTIIYTILVVAVPIVLVASSIFTMVRAMGNGDAEEIKKAKLKLVKKFIAAAIIILLAVIVRFTIGRVSTNPEDQSTFQSCLKCFLSYAEVEGVCEPSDTGNDVHRGFYTSEPDSVPINDTSSNRSNFASRYNSNPNSTPGDNGNLGSKSILVGDSRTVGLCKFNGGDQDYSAACRDIYGVAHGGKGIYWTRKEGLALVNAKLQSDAGTRYNILVWMGVNDVGNKEAYVQGVLPLYMDFFTQAANGDWKNHNIIVVAVTDIGTEETAPPYPTSRTAIKSFNTQLKSKVQSAGLSNLHYCDISSVDVKNDAWTDNVHYKESGNDKIYAAIQSTCLTGSSTDPGGTPASGGVCGSDKIYPGTKYNLSDSQKKKLAGMIVGEYDADLNGMKAVASQMANLYEYMKYLNNSCVRNRTFYEYITLQACDGCCGWYGTWNKAPSSNANALKAVEDCIVNGNRTLPHFVDEFDGYPGDVSPKLQPNEYQQGVTKITGKYGGSGKFWCATPYNNYGNLFYYSSETYRQKIGG